MFDLADFEGIQSAKAARADISDRAEQVARGIADAHSPETVLAILDALGGLIGGFEELTVARVIDVDERTDEHLLTCPHCQSQAVNYGGLVEVDSAERWTHGDEDADDNIIRFSNDERGDFEHRYYKCPACDRPVSLPLGFEVDYR